MRTTQLKVIGQFNSSNVKLNLRKEKTKDKYSISDPNKKNEEKGIIILQFTKILRITSNPDVNISKEMNIILREGPSEHFQKHSTDKYNRH